MNNPQLNKHGELQHLLTIEGMTEEGCVRLIEAAKKSASILFTLLHQRK